MAIKQVVFGLPFVKLKKQERELFIVQKNYLLINKMLFSWIRKIGKIKNIAVWAGLREELSEELE